MSALGQKQTYAVQLATSAKAKSGHFVLRFRELFPNLRLVANGRGYLMSGQQTAEITHSAYEIAWQEFLDVVGLSADERRTGTNQLRSYIRLMIAVGERDPSKIAKLALGMTRQYEQITRSKSRVGPSIHPAWR